MYHEYIEEHNIADRYLMGKLSAEEERLFEEHFLECQQCRNWLEATHHFRIGLRSACESREANASQESGEPDSHGSRLR
jgi:predicted anti-sigma-YlaC factor YlaD